MKISGQGCCRFILIVRDAAQNLRRTTKMPTENKVTLRDKKFFLEQIAERDKQIYDLQVDRDLQIAEKNRTIAAYRGLAERATERKQWAIINAERRAKLNFSYAALILAGMAIIPWLFWFIDFASKNFWLWANGR